MKHITITFCTSDNRTQANGYDPKFYDNQEKQYVDIVNDMNTAKKVFGDNLAVITVTEWEKVGEIESTTYRSIDEVIKRYTTEE